MGPWKLVWVIGAAFACGAGSKPTTATSTDATGCEPGRCLDDFAKQIGERRAETRACYDEMLKQKPGVKGRLIINFRVDANGDVIETSQGMQDDQINDEALVSCVSEVIKTVKFGKSPSGKTTRAYHQFELSPR